MNYPKEVLEALERDQGIIFRGRTTPGDGRFCYGATCTWFGSIHETKGTKGPVASIPICPCCRGVLFEMPDEGEWWTGVDQYEREAPYPGYRAMLEWQRSQKKCFQGIENLVRAYRLADPRNEERS
jgi:hypothetical protein